ncbi:MAG: phosphate butyryltransferase [Lachnospiraceae bacterium]|nr:phosphate butyryltransferase [Lachnospiraceae bacterium]
MGKSFDELLKKVAGLPMKKVAVCVSQDSAVIEAVRAAKDRKIADAILVGDMDKTQAIADELKIDISDFEKIDVKDVTEASLTAVKLVHDGKADLYMKGLIDTKGFLKSVLDKEVGLRTGKTLSHVCVFDVKGYDRLLFLTDVAFLPYPTLEDKVNIIKNTVEICEALGVNNPKVAPLAAVEVVNPKMPVTVEAEELHQMNVRGEIKDCIVDGPLSMDLAIEPEAAKHKGATDRPIQGDADILLFPDIHAGNLVYKAMVHMADEVNGNILTGTAAPVVLTSRSDSMEVKVNSLAVAALVSEYFKNK